MISTDNFVWHKHSRWPQAWELMDRNTSVWHKCTWDASPVLLAEASESIEISTPLSGVYEFLCRRCAQRVRISFKLWDKIREANEVVSQSNHNAP